jgi:hypothetical protein
LQHSAIADLAIDWGLKTAGSMIPVIDDWGSGSSRALNPQSTIVNSALQEA